MRKYMTLTLLGIAAVGLAQSSQIKVDGVAVQFDAPVKEVNGHLMVPLRSMTEAMNASFKWRMNEQVATIWKNGNSFDVRVGSREASLNSSSKTIDEAPFIHKGRLYVPLRFLAEATAYSISSEGGWIVMKNTRR